MEAKELVYCSKCVMDGSATEIILDADGVCNFCHQAQRAIQEVEAEKHNLSNILEQIKKDSEDADVEKRKDK